MRAGSISMLGRSLVKASFWMVQFHLSSISPPPSLSRPRPGPANLHLAKKHLASADIWVRTEAMTSKLFLLGEACLIASPKSLELVYVRHGWAPQGPFWANQHIETVDLHRRPLGCLGDSISLCSRAQAGNLSLKQFWDWLKVLEKILKTWLTWLV